MGTTRSFNLGDLFESVVDTVPERIALTTSVRSLTYAELDERANRLARHLESRHRRDARGHGVEPASLQDVGAVHARGGHAHQDLAVLRYGHRATGLAQHLRGAERADLHESHRLHAPPTPVRRARHAALARRPRRAIAGRSARASGGSR